MRFSIIKREPSYFFENIHEDLNRFLKDTFGDMEFIDKTNFPDYKAFRPAIEIKEKNNSYNIKIELPNVQKEDIDIELTPTSVSIKAKTKFEECKEEENLKVSEFRYGNFIRTINFERLISLDNCKSEFKNGILTLEILKKEEDKKEEVKKLKIE